MTMDNGFCIFLVISSLLSKLLTGLAYNDEIDIYEVVEPYHIGPRSRNKRDLSTKVNAHDEHLEETVFQVQGYNRNFVMHLKKNRDFLPSSFVNIWQKHDGSSHIERGIEHCYYHGYLKNCRNSSVIMATCNGIKGLIRDEDGEEFYIEPHKHAHIDNPQKHILYKMKDLKLKKNGKCGNNHTHEQDDGFTFYTHQEYDSILLDEKTFLSNDHVRKRRSTQNEMKYVETIAVLDHRKYKKYNSVSKTIQRGVELMNFVDAVYKTMNTRITLIGVIVWNKYDLIHVTASSVGETLGQFQTYVRDVLHVQLKLNPDNAQLISGVDFVGDLVGLAGVGVMCSLTSSAINQDHSGNAAVSANTIAHELGHNIGFMHNKDGCDCPVSPCVMGAYSPGSQVKGFTTCTSAEYYKRLDGGRILCILDYPDKLFGDPKCGNGYLEKGEQCDCGSKEECTKSGGIKCCDPASCKLQSGAVCATGPCCEKCQFKGQGKLCRKSFNADCDFPEYCVGNSSECPRNFYKQDGSPCNNNEAYCYEGTCKTLLAQCETLWGANAITAQNICFQINSEGSVWGNCGTDPRTSNYIKCAESDRRCGKLQCAPKSSSQPLPTFPIIGTNRGTRTVNYYTGGETIKCKMGKTSLGKDLHDPTLAVAGTKCGENKLCVERKCVDTAKLATIKNCTETCHNGGFCNNNGNCHCSPGYACPNCLFAGPGGSLDSGQGCVTQGNDCGCLTPLVKALLVVFLLIIPLCVLIGYCCYRHREKIRTKYQVYKAKQKASTKQNNESATTLQTTSTSSKNKLGIDNPYVTSSNSPSNVNVRKAPQPPPKQAKAPPNEPLPGPPPRHTTTVHPPTLPPIAGNSPARPAARPNKLPQIQAFNNMDAEAGNISSNKKWPPPSTNKSYR